LDDVPGEGGILERFAMRVFAEWGIVQDHDAV
jgi:hypothetical protein